MTLSFEMYNKRLSEHLRGNLRPGLYDGYSVTVTSASGSSRFSPLIGMEAKTKTLLIGKIRRFKKKYPGTTLHWSELDPTDQKFKVTLRPMDKQPIPMKEERPEGLHQRFVLRKVVGRKKSKFGHYYELKTKAVDPKAEYFVLRLDVNGSDPNHILACRNAIHRYADCIEDWIPDLAKDLRERYPLLTVRDLELSKEEPK